LGSRPNGQRKDANLKEAFELNGHEYIFLEWRIKPPGLADNNGIFLQPEAIYGTENGQEIDIIGLHPENVLIYEGTPKNAGRT